MKLTKVQIRGILARVSMGESRRSVAKDHDVSETAIRLVINRNGNLGKEKKEKASIALTNSYLATLLGIKVSQATPEILHLAREKILLKRAVHDLKKTLKEL